MPSDAPAFCLFFVASAFRPVWPGRCIWGLVCVPRPTRTLDQGGVEPRLAVSLRPEGHRQYHYTTDAPSDAPAFCRSYNIRCCCCTSLVLLQSQRVSKSARKYPHLLCFFDDEEWRIITLFVNHLDSKTKYTDLFAASCGSLAIDKTNALCTSTMGWLCGIALNISFHSGHVMIRPDLHTPWVRSPASHFSNDRNALASGFPWQYPIQRPAQLQCLQKLSCWNVYWPNPHDFFKCLARLVVVFLPPTFSSDGPAVGRILYLQTVIDHINMVPATGMSILALSPKHPCRAVQIPSLITSCAAKCSMGPQFW